MIENSLENEDWGTGGRPSIIESAGRTHLPGKLTESVDAELLTAGNELVPVSTGAVNPR